MLNPEFPVVEGQYQITKEWSISLPDKFNRRIEDGSLVIWHSHFTIWINVWNNNKNKSPQQLLAQIKKDISWQAYDLEEKEFNHLLFFAYRLDESKEDHKRRPALYCFSIGENGYVQMAIYFDDERYLTTAKSIWLSLKEKPSA